MKFTVTYRSADGALATDEVEAANRTDCFAQMKARGIVPMSVKEGSPKGAKPLTQRRGGDERKSRRAEHAERIDGKVPARSIGSLGGNAWKWIAVFLILCVLGGGVWWWMDRRVKDNAPSQPKTTKKTALPKAVTPAATGQVLRAESSVPSQATNAVAKPPVPPAPTGNVIKVGFTKQMITLPDGTQVPANRPKFTNAIERALSTLCNPGGMAIPFSVVMRRFSDDEIRRILNQPMIYDKADPDELVERKFAVQQLKDQFREYLDAGKSVQEAIEEIDASVRREGVYLNMARAGLTEALRTGDGEVVRAYVAEQNAELEKRGMRKLTVPKRFQLEENQNSEQGEKR